MKLWPKKQDNINKKVLKSVQIDIKLKLMTLLIRKFGSF